MLAPPRQCVKGKQLRWTTSSVWNRVFVGRLHPFRQVQEEISVRKRMDLSPSLSRLSSLNSRLEPKMCVASGLKRHSCRAIRTLDEKNSVLRKKRQNLKLQTLLCKNFPWKSLPLKNLVSKTELFKKKTAQQTYKEDPRQDWWRQPRERERTNTRSEIEEAQKRQTHQK